jgi:predicted Zn-dependent protease
MRSGRLIIALIVALVSVVGYFASTSETPLTGEKQRVAMSPEQEIALGMRAAPEMAAQMGGLSKNRDAAGRVQRIGTKLARDSLASKSPYKFSFHVLADARTVNAFALPGGPVFITEGLLRALRTEGQVAAVLGHEIGHVIARHSSEQLAKQQLTRGLLSALVLGTGDYSAAQVGQLVGGMINMRYGREDELEADALGIRIVAEGGYDPRAMVAVMETLARVSGGSQQPEFLSTHPAPENRAERIRAEIARRFPNGVPEGLVH